MKAEKIGELFRNNSQWIADGRDEFQIMDLDNFTEAINQAEKELKLEWYKILEKNLNSIAGNDGIDDILKGFYWYSGIIQNKIKELEKC